MKTMSVRPAFTLLEMVLATSIAVLLLAALYVALDLQLSRASDARSLVEQNTLVRSVITVISNDVAPGVAIVDPGRFQGSSGSGSGSGGSGTGSSMNGTGTGGTTSSPSTSGTTGASGTTGTSSSSTSSSSTSSSSGMVYLFTIVGGSDRFSIFITRMPPNQDPNALPGTTPGASDVRVVNYWVEPGVGLCRQEILQATSDDAQNPSFDASDPSTTHLAAEVTSMQVQYFDGSDLQDSWDGTQVGSDYMTPLGPPMALVLTLEITPRNTDPNAENKAKTYRHVISIPGASGSTVSTLSTSSSSSSTGSSSTGSSSTSP
jgi:type II secretory pathway pseudopilin PulG